MISFKWLVRRIREPWRSCRILAEGLRDPHSFKLGYLALTKYRAVQDLLELIPLIRFVKNRKLSNVLEIGTLQGGTLNIWCDLAEADAKIISIDLQTYSDFNEEEMVKELKSMKRGRQELVLIRGSSHADESFAAAKAALGSEQLDLLFIDGDHSYAGVKQDYETYGKLVKQNGLVVFHDINPQADATTEGVARFWKEIRKEGPVKEFFSNHPRGKLGYGIGVLEKTSCSAAIW